MMDGNNIQQSITIQKMWNDIEDNYNHLIVHDEDIKKLREEVELLNKYRLKQIARSAELHVEIEKLRFDMNKLIESIGG